MVSVIELILAALSSASMAIVLKCFRNHDGNRYSILLGNYLTCMVLSFIFLPEKQVIFHPASATIICGIAGGFLFVAGLVSMQSSIVKNGAILTSAFSKLGIIVPLIISVIFLGEKIRILQVFGVIMILISFWLISSDSSNGSSDSSNRLHVHLLLLLAVLFSCGGGDAMAKIFDYIGQRSQDNLYFLILFTTAAILTLVLLLRENRSRSNKIIPDADVPGSEDILSQEECSRDMQPMFKEFLAGVLVGIPNYFSSFLLLKSLNGLPAFVVYPCFSAGTLLLVTIAGTAIFHEHPGRRTWAGLGIIALALIILNL